MIRFRLVALLLRATEFVPTMNRRNTNDNEESDLQCQVFCDETDQSMFNYQPELRLIAAIRMRLVSKKTTDKSLRRSLV